MQSMNSSGRDFERLKISSSVFGVPMRNWTAPSELLTVIGCFLESFTI